MAKLLFWTVISVSLMKIHVITFKTDKFSTYAIVYTDKAKEVISGGSEAGGKDNTDNETMPILMLKKSQFWEVKRTIQ